MLARAVLLMEKAHQYMPNLSAEAMQETQYLQTPVTFAARDYVAAVMQGNQPAALQFATSYSQLLIAAIRAAYAIGHQNGAAMGQGLAGLQLAPDQPASEPLTPSTDLQSESPADPQPGELPSMPAP